MNTHKVATHYPENWANAKRGDVITYTSKREDLAATADAMQIHDANTDALLVTGHVVGIRYDVWPVRYEVRVNVNHAGGAA